jgi:hypothetical protein
LRRSETLDARSIRVSREQHELEDVSEAPPGAAAGDDLDELEDDAEESVDVAGDDAVEDEAGLGEHDDDSEQASWEELLAERAKRGADDHDDVSELMALSSEARTPPPERAASRTSPVRDRQEFVCVRCHLVKPRTQLADPQRGLCRDCA